MSTVDPAPSSTDAVSGRRAAFLPFSRPTIEEDEIAQVVDSLRSGWITTGPKVTRFEEMFTERLGGHAVAIASATAGLHVTIAAFDPKPGDEFIVPAMTWASTANVVELCGARTVFADVDPDTLQIDPADVARRITPRTRAIIPVHYAGQPADLDALRALADAHGLSIIEDAAHALGTAYKGVEIGRGSEVAVYSFHPIKNVTTGEGGMVVCRDEAFAERLRLLRFHGVSKDAWKRYRKGGGPRYDVLEPAWKYNMMDLQAALGLEQMKKLERFNARRAVLGERYDRLFADVPGIAPLERVKYDHHHAWHLYVVRLDLSTCSLDRDAFIGALTEENIGVGLHFPALHMATYYREKYGHGPGTLPNAEQAGETILSLPLYPLMTEADQDDVVAAVKRVLAAHPRS